MYKKILVPIDGSPASKHGLNEAITLAKACKAHIRLLHVVGMFVATPGFAGPIPGAVPKLLHASGSRLLKRCESQVCKHRVKVDSALVDIAGGRIADAVVAHARKWHADLIIVGTHGRTGIARLALGSDAERVVRVSPVPVLVVRPRRTARR
jgi:nucleotide-binding universal stress UspA family protein